MATTVTGYPQARNTAADLDAVKRLVLKLRPHDGETYATLSGDLGYYPSDVALIKGWWNTHDRTPYKEITLISPPVKRAKSGMPEPGLHVFYYLVQETSSTPWKLISAEGSSE